MTPGAPLEGPRAKRRESQRWPNPSPGPPHTHTCLSRQAGGSPSRSREGRTEGPASPLQPRRCVLGWGGTLPCSCVSASVRPTHLWLTHRPAPSPPPRHLRVQGAKSQDTSASPSFTLCTHPPPPTHTHSTDSVASGHEHHATPCRDVTWGRTLRHYMGVEGGQSSWSQDSHSLSRRWGWARQYRPHRARLAHPQKRRLAARRWGGGLPSTSASSPQPAAPPGPPLTL